MKTVKYLCQSVLKEFLLAISLVFFAGVQQANSQGLDQVSKAVVFLEHDSVETYSDARGTFEVWLKQPNTNLFFPKIVSTSGTGFLVGHGNNLYLVTAKHVAKNLGFTDNDKFVTGLKDGKAAILPLGLLRGASTNDWIHHEKADVSILPLNPAPQVWPYLQEHFLDYSSFLESVTNRPSRDYVITIVGFPLGEGWGREVGEEFAPLTRKTRASSGFIEGGTLFLLEDPSVEGYSGAPVFDLAEPLSTAGFYAPAGRPVTCLGIVSSTIADNTGGKMAGVVPTKCIVELIKKWETR